MLGNILSQLLASGVTGYANSYNKKAARARKNLLKLAVNGEFKTPKADFTVGYGNIDVECYILSMLFAVISVVFILPETITLFIEKQVTARFIVGVAVFVTAVVIFAIGRLSKKFPVLKVGADGIEHKRHRLELRNIRELEIKNGKLRIIDQYGEIFFSCDETCAGAVDLAAWVKEHDIPIFAPEFD